MSKTPGVAKVARVKLVRRVATPYGGKRVWGPCHGDFSFPFLFRFLFLRYCNAMAFALWLCGMA